MTFKLDTGSEANIIPVSLVKELKVTKILPTVELLAVQGHVILQV